MDHLPIPPDSPHTKLLVPLLLSKSVRSIDCSPGAGNFLHNWRDSDQQSVQSLQRWLYFGLLSSFLETAVDVRDFSSRNGKYIDSKELPERLKRNMAKIQNRRGNEAILYQVERELRHFIHNIPNMRQNGKKEAQLIVLSIRVLCDSLQRTLQNNPEFASPEYKRRHPSYKNQGASPGIDCDPLRDRMRKEDGWCKALVTRILTTLTSSSAYYLSSISREGSNSYPGANHNRCTEKECRLHADEATYQPSHSPDCSGINCRRLKAPSSILGIIDSGKIPVVSYDGNSLAASEVKFGLEYTAITHVWAGGLGNPQGNAMHSCQLEHIAKLPRSCHQVLRKQRLGKGNLHLYHDMPALRLALDPLRLASRKQPRIWFWVDTLCIPREAGSDTQRIRAKAINRMTPTYATANATVVIDPELRQCDIDNKFQQWNVDSLDSQHHALALFARIFCSTWMTRCWTYHEAVTATHLFVLFKNAIFPLNIIREKVVLECYRSRTKYQSTDDLDILDEISTWYSRLPSTGEMVLMGDWRGRPIQHRPEISKSQENPEIFTQVWNDIAARTTSRKIDRLQIFSLLVDIRPSDVMSINFQNRLQAILMAQEKLPLALLFQTLITNQEAEEIDTERKMQMEWDRKQGVGNGVFREDETYPLPRIIRSSPIPYHLGWMEIHTSPISYLSFNTKLLDAGSIKPSLFKLPLEFNAFVRSGGACTLQDQQSQHIVQFRIFLQGLPERIRISDDDTLFLLLSTDIGEEDLDIALSRKFLAVLLVLLPSHSHSVRRFRFIRHSSCETLVGHPTGRLFQVQRCQIKQNTDYQIQCNFIDVPILRPHSTRICMNPMTASVEIGLSETGLIVTYYVFFLGMSAAFAFAKSSASFSPGFYGLIVFLVLFRIFHFVLITNDQRLRAAKSIVFDHWVRTLDDAQDNDSRPDDQRLKKHRGFSINMRPLYTIVFFVLSAMFFAVGVVERKSKSGRWMIPVGLAGLGELFIRWMCEVFHESFSKTSCFQFCYRPRFRNELERRSRPAEWLPNEILHEEYWSPSRLTVYIKRVFGR